MPGRSPNAPPMPPACCSTSQDFIDEQTYHRGRLARALAFLAGGGTLAGLEVTHRPADTDQPEEIKVAPGSPSTASAGSSRFRVPPACGSTAGLPARSCATGAIRFAPRPMTPRSFHQRTRRRARRAAGTRRGGRCLSAFRRVRERVDAELRRRPVRCVDAVAPARLRDAYELQLVARADHLGDTFTGLPDPGIDLGAIADIAARRAALQDAILDAYPMSGAPARPVRSRRRPATRPASIRPPCFSPGCSSRSGLTIRRSAPTKPWGSKFQPTLRRERSAARALGRCLRAPPEAHRMEEHSMIDSPQAPPAS